ncbi:MAG: 50S ribosomal protein L3 [Patescibacteria group bacterium]
MKFIIGKKKGMTRIFGEDGKVIPVTIVVAPPCQVISVKTEDKDGYNAVLVGSSTKKKMDKARAGLMKGLDSADKIKEFRVEDASIYQRGQSISVANFTVGDQVAVTGISKGRGFAGVVKKYGFHGAPASHGTKDQLRMPGSSGATGPAHVFKGTRKPGRYGGKQITQKNLIIKSIDIEKNIINIQGAIPGSNNGWLLVNGPGDMKLNDKEAPINDTSDDKMTEPTAVQDNKKGEKKND